MSGHGASVRAADGLVAYAHGMGRSGWTVMMLVEVPAACVWVIVVVAVWIMETVLVGNGGGHRVLAPRRVAGESGAARVLADTMGVDLATAAPETVDEIRRETAGELPDPGWWIDVDDATVEVWWNGAALTDLTRRRSAQSGKRAAKDTASVEPTRESPALRFDYRAPVDPSVQWGLPGELVGVSTDDGAVHVDLTGTTR